MLKPDEANPRQVDALVMPPVESHSTPLNDDMLL
jgi:hypothetical protein